MNKNVMKILWVAAVILVCFSSLEAQNLGGMLKDKVRRETNKALNKPTTPNRPDTDRTSEDNSSSGTMNRGGGLINTPPDVSGNISEAESAVRATRYKDARYAIRQAMIGVEMEIGQQVLDNLPSTVSQLPKLDGSDKVTSTGAGWVGLTIHRIYQRNDQQLTFTVANNAGMLAATNAYLTNASAYGTSADQNWKNVTVQGNRGILEYNDYSGYKLSVPLGQNSIFLLEGINFNSEPDLLAAAEKFDLNLIKNQIGEK